MNQIYIPSDNRGNLPAAAGLGSLCALSLFALLPLLSALPGLLPGWRVISPPTIPADPPPVVDLPDKTNIEPPKPQVLPEIEPPPVLMTITMMEILLAPGGNGASVSTGWPSGIEAPTTTGEEFLWSQVDRKPVALMAVKPNYPYEMKGVSGEAIVEFIIDRQGVARRPVIRRSTHWQFEKPAIDAVLKSKWQPGAVNGEAVDTRVQLPVRFSR